MTVGHGQKLEKLKAKLDYDNRYIDMAVQFVEYVKTSSGPDRTGRISKIYGGVWDRLAGCWSRDSPKAVIEISTHGEQLNYIESMAVVSVYSAGRGDGKSRTAAGRFVKKVLSEDITEILVLSEEFKTTKAIFKYIRQLLPADFILEYKWDKQDKYLIFMNGVKLTPISGVRESKARSESASIGHVDECQIVKKDRYEAFVGSIREGAYPSLSMTGTMSDRMDEVLTQLEDEKDLGVEIFYGDPRKNPWLSEQAHRLRCIGMSKRAYAIEIENNRKLIQSDKEDERPRLFPTMGKRHLVNLADVDWSDTTAKQSIKRFRKRAEHIVVYDPNRGDPNYSVVFKVFEDKYLIAIDMILALGHCGRLAKTLTERGYNPQNTIVLDDASAKSKKIYDKYSSTSPRELFKNAGYVIWNESRTMNPNRIDSVEHFNSLLDPISGLPRVRISIDLDTAEHTIIKDKVYPGLYQDMCSVKWADKHRDAFYKHGTRDDTHGADCFRLGAWYVFPPIEMKKHGMTVISPDGSRVQL